MFQRAIGRMLGLFALVGAVGLSACAGPDVVGDAPRDNLATPVALHDYQIGPGDQLDIFVWRNPELSARVPVRPDGRVSMPLIEDLVVTRKTPAVVAREIEKTLSQYIQDPVVTVLVTGFSGPYTQQIRIAGEVGHPTIVAYRENMTVLDAMIVAGGLGQFASGNRAVITRLSPDGLVNLRVRLDTLLRDGDMAANVRLVPGDTIFVPQSYF